MKNRLFDDVAIAQMLDDDALEKRRRDPGVPDGIRVDDDDRAAPANSQAWRFSPFDPRGPEQEPFALKQCRQHRVQVPATSVRRAEASGADEDMA